MSNKRYYWLKLNENFFEDDTIEWIEEQENGERYVLFYLKLCLKSLKDEGNLIRYVGEKLIPYDVKSLAKLTNTDQDTVAVSLRVFEEIGLIERTDAGEIYMKQIDEMIGTETDSARRVRKHRVRQKEIDKRNENNQELLQCNADETKSNTNVQKSDTEIEKEKELELEKEKEKEKEREEEKNGRSGGLKIDENVKLIARAYEQGGFGTVGPTDRELIIELSEEYSTEWIVQAFKTAVEKNIRTLAYVRGILKTWKIEGGMKLGGKKGEGSNGNSEEDKGELDCEGDKLYQRAVEKYGTEGIADEDIPF